MFSLENAKERETPKFLERFRSQHSEWINSESKTKSSGTINLEVPVSEEEYDQLSRNLEGEEYSVCGITYFDFPKNNEDEPLSGRVIKGENPSIYLTYRPVMEEQGHRIDQDPFGEMIRLLSQKRN